MQALQKWQRICHENFGEGMVISSDEERTAIEFSDHGLKLFVTSILKARLVEEAPAGPPNSLSSQVAASFPPASPESRKERPSPPGRSAIRRPPCGPSSRRAASRLSPAPAARPTAAEPHGRMQLETKMKKENHGSRPGVPGTGDAIRRLRKSRGMTQRQLTEAAGLSRTHFQDIERGRRNPSLSVLKKISEALRTHLGRFLIRATPSAGGA